MQLDGFEVHPLSCQESLWNRFLLLQQQAYCSAVFSVSMFFFMVSM